MLAVQSPVSPCGAGVAFSAKYCRGGEVTVAPRCQKSKNNGVIQLERETQGIELSHSLSLSLTLSIPPSKIRIQFIYGARGVLTGFSFTYKVETSIEFLMLTSL